MTDESTEPGVVVELERLRAEIRALKGLGVSMEVGRNGWLTVYGIDRQYPVTRPAEQWIRFLDLAPEIRAFIKENEAELVWKEAA